MEKLNFNSNKYKEIALNIKLDVEKIHTPEDAFFLLINGYDYESLNNLCALICHRDYLDEEESYEYTQNLNLNQNYKKVITDLAKKCLDIGFPLGSKLINNGTINTTAWLGHCVYVGEVCANLARILGLDDNIARTLGLLHDYGRKYDHSFNHVITGFESLVDINWNNEAIACLTHSFVNGGRCSNNEHAIKGFYVDEEGNPKWKPETKKDDISLFLENYEYTDYDIILNIADLMATSKCIVSPYERIKDIATRRTIDPRNRAYFLADITNTLIDFLKKINYLEEDFPHIKATKNIELNEIETIFKEVSNYFYAVYQKLTNQNELNIADLEVRKIRKLIKETRKLTRKG